MLALAVSIRAAAEDDFTGFTRASLDIGLVVRDVDTSVKFYRALGFREVDGFAVSGKLAAAIGLSTGKPVQVRLLEMGDAKLASRIKVLPLPQNGMQRPHDTQQTAVNARPGLRYLTIFAKDLNVISKRLTEAGFKLPGESPVRLGNDATQEVLVVILTDPDGNVVELVVPLPNK